MIIGYIVVTNRDPSNFIDEVNKRIKDGWTPQGGVVVLNLLDSDIALFQAMIMEAK